MNLSRFNISVLTFEYSACKPLISSSNLCHYLYANLLFLCVGTKCIIGFYLFQFFFLCFNIGFDGLGSFFIFFIMFSKVMVSCSFKSSETLSDSTYLFASSSKASCTFLVELLYLHPLRLQT